jgi:hypothetical protein
MEEGPAMKLRLSAIVLVAVVALLWVPSPAMAASNPCTPATWTDCPKAGDYAPGNNPGGEDQNATIHDDPSWHIVWHRAEVLPYDPGHVPEWFKVTIWYFNETQETRPLVCPTGNAPEDQRSKEWFLRDGQYLGSVSASSTFCDSNPGYTIQVPQGGVAEDWAVFHNVPWIGDAISIPWGGWSGQSQYIDPYRPVA